MYQSSPVGYDDQPEFINSVLELTINDQPGSETQSGSAYRALFEAMQVIESTLGRQRVAGNQNAPRVIDIDLLLYADMRIREPDLVVPHPRMHERLFVLQPLQELNPTLAKQYANTDTSVFSGQRIQRLRL